MAHPNPQARQEDIARCEAAIGAPLPDWLRERLLRENGWQVDDSNGATREEWRFLPVLDRSNRKRMVATAEDIAYHTQKARGFPGMVVVARAWDENHRLVLLPNPAHPERLGDALFRQNGKGAPLDHAFAFAEIGRKRALKVGQRAASELPRFRYHPDPIATGAIALDPDAVCPCCDTATGWAYRMQPYAVDNVSDLCPWCIADGSAARKFDAAFIADIRVEEDGVARWFLGPETAEDTSVERLLPPEVVDELLHRTPGFVSFQQEEWQACCGDACAFLGMVDSEKVTGLSAAFRERYGLTDPYVAWLKTMSPHNLRRHADPGVFLFQCLHCGDTKAWLDYS